jgi:hypothetical protein
MVDDASAGLRHLPRDTASSTRKGTDQHAADEHGSCHQFDLVGDIVSDRRSSDAREDLIDVRHSAAP